jgi:glyoxylase-like metal-dependent hydrolase (beta-lactamase superfamily II)
MSAEQRKSIPDTPREIAPGVFVMEVGRGFQRSNVCFVRSGTAWVLVDAASRGAGPLLRRTAAALFGPEARPAAILLTHDHPDHTGDARELARGWDCPVYVHPAELPLTDIRDLATVERYANPLDRRLILPLLRRMPPRRVREMFERESLAGVVRALDPAAGVPGLPDWTCLPTPGHTPGHVAFLRPADRVLISGDALLTADLNSLPGTLRWILHLNRPVLSSPPWYSTFDRRAAEESRRVLAAVKPLVLAPGHGMVVDHRQVLPVMPA